METDPAVFATAKSSLPSPFRSAITRYGLSAVPSGYKVCDWKVPSPLPKRMETPSPDDTARSSRPSPLKSRRYLSGIRASVVVNMALERAISVAEQHGSLVDSFVRCCQIEL